MISASLIEERYEGVACVIDVRERRNSLGGHNTRNFGISTVAGATTTAQWNTLNGPHIPKANKVCYRLLHLRGYASGSIHVLRATCYVENILHGS